MMTKDEMIKEIIDYLKTADLIVVNILHETLMRYQDGEKENENAP